jgi:uncharacterized protein YpbB
MAIIKTEEVKQIIYLIFCKLINQKSSRSILYIIIKYRRSFAIVFTILCRIMLNYFNYFCILPIQIIGFK